MTYGGTTIGGTTYAGTASNSISGQVQSVDTDASATTLSLHPTLTPTDTDTSTTVVKRHAVALSTDTDISTTLARVLAITDTNDSVQAVVDILSESGGSAYLVDPPDAVAPLSQNRPKARKGEEKAIWVWSSAATDIDDFDAEYSRTTRTATVEAILQLNQSDRESDFADVATFAEDVVQLISRYARDNKTKTQFHSIKVVQREDRRAQNIPTNSLPYDVALTIELTRLVETA